jgi:hypothetical protein
MSMTGRIKSARSKSIKAQSKANNLAITEIREKQKLKFKISIT